jgi:mannosyltransferase OCH1-like enzyme
MNQLFFSGKKDITPKQNDTQINYLELNDYLAIPYPIKSRYDLVIPQDIYQTWQSKMIPPLMFKAISKIKKHNPMFKYHLYDDNNCREFIKAHFREDVVDAYDRLIPGAYKADLWRYCILFIKGGIYLDIKYAPLNGFKFINLCESEHLVLDKGEQGIYNALMVCKPGNQLLFKAIRQIVANVKNKWYGNCFLSPTGPKLLTKFISVNDPIVDLKHEELLGDNNYKIIYYNNIPILKSYNGHTIESRQNSNKQHYSILWQNKEIYA